MSVVFEICDRLYYTDIDSGFFEGGSELFDSKRMKV